MIQLYLCQEAGKLSLSRRSKVDIKIDNDADVSSNLKNDGAAIPPIPDDTYPADEDMRMELQQDEWLMPWRELPLNIWLQITHQRDVKLERGVVKILTLVESDGTTCTSLKAWSTISISEKVGKLPSSALLFVKCLGMETSPIDPSRSYFKTEFTYF